jgi:phage terminase Nu1 subunit (DNA packaging protein)
MGRKPERALKGPVIVTTTEVAEFLTLTRPRIDQLAQDGWIKRVGRNQFDLKDAVQGYVRFMRQDQRRTTTSAADSRVRDARARDIEARTAERLGRLVSLNVYDEMIDGFAGLVRSELAGLPASCTRDLPTRRIIERELNARLTRMAEYARAQSVRVETVRGADDAERANGAGRLGSGKSDVPTDSGGAGA